MSLIAKTKRIKWNAQTENEYRPNMSIKQRLLIQFRRDPNEMTENDSQEDTYRGRLSVFSQYEIYFWVFYVFVWLVFTVFFFVCSVSSQFGLFVFLLGYDVVRWVIFDIQSFIIYISIWATTTKFMIIIIITTENWAVIITQNT